MGNNDNAMSEKTATLVCEPETGNHRNTINQQIAALEYDPHTVMAFNGTQIANVDKPIEDKFEGSTYIVVTREKCGYEGNFDVAVPTAFDDITYPGALLLANNDLLDGRPQQLAADREPLDFTVTLPGADDLSFRVEPNYKNVLAGINARLAHFFESRGQKWEFPANFQYSSSLVFDEKELALKFGCDITYLKQKLGVDFSRKSTDKRSIYIVRFKQVFYTVSAERPTRPADVFGETTTWEDLARAGVNEKHPPLFVKNVQYGRQIFLKFESSLSATELESTVKGVCNCGGLHVDAHLEADYRAKLDQVEVSVVALGGSTSAFKAMRLGSLDDVKTINSIIWEHTELSPSNPAAPLNYYTVFLKDGAPGMVSGKTEYIAEKTEIKQGGRIHLQHDGAYVASFHVYWDEIAYVNGVKTTKRVAWADNGRNVTAGYQAEIPLLGNARNIGIKAEGAWFFASWHTSGDRLGLALVPNRSVRTGGTSLSQSFTMTPAD